MNKAKFAPKASSALIPILTASFLVSAFGSPACLAQAKASDLNGIAHVAFRVSDLQKSRAFYETLGFEQAFGFQDDGKTSVSYMKINDSQFIELYQRKNDTQALGLQHFCFEADPIESAYRYYAERGVESKPPRKAHAGNMLFLFRDPEGHTVEFTQYMPGSLHYEQRGKHLSAQRLSDHFFRATLLVANVAVERHFYETKLGFRPATRDGRTVLRLSGASGQQMELVKEAAGATPEIVFAVSDLRRTLGELRKRGLMPVMKHGKVIVEDPDGTTVAFEVSRSSAMHP